MSASEPSRGGVRPEDQVDLLARYANVPIRSFNQAVNEELLRRAADEEDDGSGGIPPAPIPSEPPKSVQADKDNKWSLDKTTSDLTKDAMDAPTPDDIHKIGSDLNPNSPSSEAAPAWGTTPWPSDGDVLM